MQIKSFSFMLVIGILCGQLSAQNVLLDRAPDPALLGTGVIGGQFVDRPGEAVSPLTLVSFPGAVTVNTVTVYTTNLNEAFAGVGYPVGGTSPAILNIFIADNGQLPIGSDTLSGGVLGDPNVTASYTATDDGIEITVSDLEINLPPGLTYLIGITPVLNFGTNGQEFFLDAGANGATTFLDNPGGAFFTPIFGTRTINANILDLPTPYTGMAIRITEDSVLKGDLNGDGLVNLLDVSPFVDAIASSEFVPAADVNCDGEVNLLDVEPFIALLSGG